MDSRYLFGTKENKAFLKKVRENLLDFGRRFPSPAGTAYYLGDDGAPMKEKTRDCYETARMAHAYSIGTMLGYEGSHQLASAAVHGLLTEQHDDVNGGWFSSIAPDGIGLPVPGKQCYAHAFVMLAACSGILTACEGSQGLLGDALKIYDRYFWNEQEGLSADTWNTQFTLLDSYRGLNANMHSVEAFLAVADCAGLDEYRVRAGRIIDHVISWAGANNWRIPEHYSDRWVPDLECNADKPDDQFKPYGATPGHGIEWARLITQWALSTYPMDRRKALPYIEASQHLFDRAAEDAWDCDGAPGIVYTTDWNGKPVVHDRMHWTLAEGINTAAVLYKVTNKEKYADQYAQFMQYLDEKVIDHVKGSWFHQLDEHNQLKETVWPGKPDIYHALQATLIPYADPAVSIAAYVKDHAEMF